MSSEVSYCVMRDGPDEHARDAKVELRLAQPWGRAQVTNQMSQMLVQINDTVVPKYDSYFVSYTEMVSPPPPCAHALVVQRASPKCQASAFHPPRPTCGTGEERTYARQCYHMPGTGTVGRAGVPPLQHRGPPQWQVHRGMRAWLPRHRPRSPRCT